MLRWAALIALVGYSVLAVPSAAHAAPCLRICKPAIRRCVDAGYRRAGCKRQLVRACRFNGRVACDEAFVPTPTTLPPTPTTTLPAAPQCFTDADCQDANACNGLERCKAGVCVLGTPLLCGDGTAALWLGAATAGAAGYVNIGLAICRNGFAVSGGFACTPGTLACIGASSPITGAISLDGSSIVFNPLVFPNGDACGFRGLLVGLTMGGNFICVDAFGGLVSAGTWALNRCP